jgi:DNA (cytosine-5)-methyltransferase 1
MKILNLYACLGGNRYKWGDDHEITAVELDPELARLYKERFPNDTVLVEDAHEFLKNNYSYFDFIWSSPPCPSHSRARYWGCKNGKRTVRPIYPDLKLYEEILFLSSYFEGKYCVENVIPYYEPLIPAKKRGRHLYWTNFLLPSDLKERRFAISATKNELHELSEFHEFDFSKYNGDQSKVKIGRNLVDFEAGKTILDTALGIKKQSEQSSLF